MADNVVYSQIRRYEVGNQRYKVATVVVRWWPCDGRFYAKAGKLHSGGWTPRTWYNNN